MSCSLVRTPQLARKKCKPIIVVVCSAPSSIFRTPAPNTSNIPGMVSGPVKIHQNFHARYTLGFPVLLGRVRAYDPEGRSLVHWAYILVPLLISDFYKTNPDQACRPPRSFCFYLVLR